MSQQLHALYYAAVSALHYRFWVLQTFSLLMEINSNIMKIREAAATLHVYYLHILANLFRSDKKCPKYVRNEQR